MTGTAREPCCSFCRAPRSKVRKLIEGCGAGKPVFICNLCVKLAQSPLATVAYCVGCRATNGKHEPFCPEQKDYCA
jgi:hypothetical protein